MAVTQLSKPFDGLGNQYYWSDLVQVWMQMANQGVCRIDDNLGNNISVYANNGGMYVFMTSGFAMVQGYLYQLSKLNTDPDLQLTINNNTSGVTRFDRVILRLNTNQNSTGITALVVQGAGGAPPSLTRSGGIYDISIAQVTVANNATTIPVANITDERDNYSVCGWVGQDLSFLSSAGGADNVLLSLQAQQVTGVKTFNSETVMKMVSGGQGQLRFVAGNYGSFWRNDGSNTYLLLTNSGDQLGTWNALRPFYVNDATGAVNLAATTVTGNLTVSSGTLSIPNGEVQGYNVIWNYVSTSIDYSIPGYGYFVLADATSGTRTIYLPNAASAPAMAIENIKKWDGTSNVVNIVAVGGQNIDGLGTYTLYSQYDSLTLRNDGSATWFVQ